MQRFFVFSSGAFCKIGCGVIIGSRIFLKRGWYGKFSLCYPPIGNNFFPYFSCFLAKMTTTPPGSMSKIHKSVYPCTHFTYIRTNLIGESWASKVPVATTHVRHNRIIIVALATVIVVIGAIPQLGIIWPFGLAKNGIVLVKGVLFAHECGNVTHNFERGYMKPATIGTGARDCPGIICLIWPTCWK